MTEVAYAVVDIPFHNPNLTLGVNWSFRVSKGKTVIWTFKYWEFNDKKKVTGLNRTTKSKYIVKTIFKVVMHPHNQTTITFEFKHLILIGSNKN